MSTITRCELCGEPMPKGEEMFKYHGHSGPCPLPYKKGEKASEGIAWPRLVSLLNDIAKAPLPDQTAEANLNYLVREYAIPAQHLEGLSNAVVAIRYTRNPVSSKIDAKPVTREEFVQLADWSCWESNDPEKALGELFDQLKAQFEGGVR